MKQMFTIYYDLDGVGANWNDKAMDILGIKDRTEAIRRLKSGEKLVDLFEPLRDIIENAGSSFWEEIEPLPWIHKLFDMANKHGHVYILTSSGDYHKRAQYVADGARGKTIWVAKHVPSEKLIISRYKEACANPYSMLVDDTLANNKRFEERGGHTYLWPNQYKILDDEISIDDVISELESKIISIKKELNIN